MLVDLILDLEAAIMLVMMIMIMMLVMMIMIMIMMLVMMIMIMIMMLVMMMMMMVLMMTVMMVLMMMTIITKDLDLFGSICHIHRSIRYRPTHLPSHPLQRREEHTVDQCWLEVSEARSYIPGHTEVCILIYRTGDKARHLVVVAKGYTEGGREGRTCLDGRERALADVIRCCEPEDGLTLGHEDS